MARTMRRRFGALPPGAFTGWDLPTVRSLDMVRFSGLRAFSALQMDALDLFASSFVAHLHLFEPCTVHFRRRRSVNGLCLAHGFPREVRRSGKGDV
jgi:hypothetical protein